MKINSYDLPRPHLIIENFIPIKLNKLFYNIINNRLSEFKSGKIHNKLDIRKSNRNLMMNADPLKKILQSYIFSTEMKKYLGEHRNPIYQTILSTNADTCMVSVYDNDDYYAYHKDESEFLTCSYLLCKPPMTFKGGDFLLKFNSEVKRIPFKNNMLIVFPNTTEHSVSTVKTKTNKLEDARISVQYWAYRK